MVLNKPIFAGRRALSLSHTQLDTGSICGSRLSWLGSPDRVHYDVRQLLGPGRMNDYFDLDMYYGAAKVSVKSSYFRIKPRPSFVV
jgi:hypothetical protein